MGPGMGIAIARKFASKGFDIIQLARRESALEEYAQSLRSEVKVTSYPIDVSDFEGLIQTFDQIQNDHGEVDLLVFNVSVLNEAAPSTISMDVMVNEFKINVASALVCAQKVIPYMTARKSGKIFLTGGGPGSGKSRHTQSQCQPRPGIEAAWNSRSNGYNQWYD